MPYADAALLNTILDASTECAERVRAPAMAQ
jgi:hypothetical protein